MINEKLNLNPNDLKYRMFASFKDNSDFLSFMGDRLTAKGFGNADTGPKWVERYLNSWVFLNLEKQDKQKYDNLFTPKLNIYNTWSTRWNSLA